MCSLESLAETVSNIDWRLIVGGTIIGGTVVYVYTNRAQKHDNIPTLDEEDFHPILGHIPITLRVRDRLNETFYENIKKLNYPNITSMCRFWNIHSVFLNHPIYIKYVFEDKFECFVKGSYLKERYFELLGNGIFMNDGNEWKLHRKAASRLFSMRNLKNFMYKMSVKHTINTMNKLKSINSTININDILGRFTLDTFCEIAFGKDINTINLYPIKHEFSIAFDDMVEIIGARSNDIFWKIKRILNIGTEKQIYKNYKILQQFVKDIIANKEISHISDETGSCSHDLLSLFLKFDPNLTDDELKDIAMNFIIAGRDTTRLLLSWFIHELSKKHNQKIKQTLYTEIDEFIAIPNYNDFITKFKYLEAVLCETLRLNPSVPFLARRAIKDMKLPNVDNKEYTIREGDYVIVHTYSYSRNPKIWKDPLKFDPLRFIKKGINEYDAYKYPQFNINPRLCLGKQFAMTEAKIFAFYFIKQFHFEMVDPDQYITIKPGAVLNMRDGLNIKLFARS